jgi:hypothetical protein
VTTRCAVTCIIFLHVFHYSSISCCILSIIIDNFRAHCSSSVVMYCRLFIIVIIIIRESCIFVSLSIIVIHHISLNYIYSLVGKRNIQKRSSLVAQEKTKLLISMSIHHHTGCDSVILFARDFLTYI